MILVQIGNKWRTQSFFIPFIPIRLPFFLSDDAIRVPIIDWKSLVRKSSTFRLSLTPPFLGFLFPYSVERVRAAPTV